MPEKTTGQDRPGKADCSLPAAVAVRLPKAPHKGDPDRHGHAPRKPDPSLEDPHPRRPADHTPHTTGDKGDSETTWQREAQTGWRRGITPGRVALHCNHNSRRFFHSHRPTLQDRASQREFRGMPNVLGQINPSEHRTPMSVSSSN